MVSRRGPGPGVRPGQRPAARRRRPGDERGLRGPLPLAAAVPGADRGGAAGLRRRELRRLSHAGPVGGERPGPDRLRLQGLDPDDRGFRPRDAGGPHGRGDRDRERVRPRGLRAAAAADRPLPAGQDDLRAPAARPRVRAVEGKVLPGPRGGQEDFRQAGPLRGRQGPQGKGPRRNDSRPGGGRGPCPRRLQRRVAPAGASSGPRPNPCRHPARRPRLQSAPRDRLQGGRAPPGPRRRHVPAG